MNRETVLLERFAKQDLDLVEMNNERRVENYVKSFCTKGLVGQETVYFQFFSWSGEKNYSKFKYT